MTRVTYSRRVAAVVALTLAAACAGGGVSSASGNSAFDREGAPIPMLPPPGTATIVLEHATELGITESQRNSLLAIRRGLDSVNAPLRTRLDSLRPAARPINPRDLSAEQREEIRARRAAVASVMNGFRDNNAMTRSRVMDVLTVEQRSRVAVLEEEAQRRTADEADRQAQREANDRGGMGRGRPPRD